MTRQKAVCVECGLVKSASVHVGYGDDKHDYIAPPREGFGSQRQALRPVGERGEERQREWSAAKKEQLSVKPTCEYRQYALPGRCSGPTDVHHVIPRGSGGGKDHGIYATLCRWHHEYVETHRAEAKEKGLLKRPPTSATPRRTRSRFA